MSVKSVRLFPSSHRQMLPPTWRWEQAAWKIATGQRVRRDRHDRWSLVARDFQKALAAGDSHLALERLSERFPGVYEAWTFYSDAEQATRWTIEAYLCASASFEHIAEQTGEHVDTIFCYASLFFDVVGKQHHRLYMLNKVLGPSVHAGLSGRSYDLLWKLFGMLKGPMFLDRLIYGEGEPSRMTSHAQGTAIEADLIRTNMGTKALYTARTIWVDYNQEIILNAYQRMVEIEKETDGGADGASLIIRNINKTINAFGFAVATPDADAAVQAPWLGKNGIELRTSEMVGRALGYEPAADAVIDAFPEPVTEKPVVVKDD